MEKARSVEVPQRMEQKGAVQLELDWLRTEAFIYIQKSFYNTGFARVFFSLVFSGVLHHYCLIGVVVP